MTTTGGDKANDRTTAQRAVRVVGAVLFLSALFAVPVTQLAWWTTAGEIREQYRTFGYVAAPRPSVDAVLDGSYMLQLERHLQEESPLVWEVRGAYNEWRYRLGLLQTDKVRVGSDGWMFYRQGMAPDAAVVEGMHEHRIAAFAAVKAALQQMGAGLFVVVLPDKDRLYPEFAYADGRMPPLKARLYPLLMQELQAAGVSHLDADAVLQQAKAAAPAELLYCRRDSHWTPLGARTVAAAMAEALERGPQAPLLGPPADGLAVTEFAAVDLLPDLVGLCGMRYVMRPMPELGARFPFPASALTASLVESKRYFRIAPAGGAEAAARLRRASALALAGTSFSGDNGAAFYAMALRRPFHDEVVMVGAGALAPMQAVLAHLLAAPGSIRLVVWEIVERGVLEAGWTAL